MKKNSIIIFAKYPEKGKVKTRLAKSMGDKKAAEFYKLCAEHTFSECEKIKTNSIDIFLFYSSTNDETKIKNWVNRDFYFQAQTGNDLGEKMKNAFQNVFNKGSEKILIIGTDLPDLSSEILSDAFNALDNFDSVVGPTNDGGYYLLGLKSQMNFLFENIKWSTEEVFEKTISKLKSGNKSVKILQELVDIDTEFDLQKWLNQSPETSEIKQTTKKIISLK